MIRILALVAAMGVFPMSADATSLDGQGTYDLLFRTGTLDEIDRGTALVYERETSNTLLPAAEARDNGEIALAFDKAQEELAVLEFRQGDKHRGLGRFPASVGNPMIMYFYETVIRDMAEAAGGSPFYIRNRVKEALVTPSEAVEGEAMVDGHKIATQTIVLRPFEGDPNRDRMQGFGDLEMRVVMSDDVPGWYLAFTAEAADVYSTNLQFSRQEPGQ
ncbi:hypothetical protein EDD52_10545 [Primorskyibacter sedentarius]|uniref:Uncharacterized protein n=1 Tax=Primorskyibacter sedentarius TaxID=745311 RepID=A0A4R3JG67_9RHOB|nr:hypothetical protein [Primorskyibacter sedentarius]TCS64485.1 hypothetical protein EDD52_10545 [Primorskyibacter sedentarius]